jgi:hypothetical protein
MPRTSTPSQVALAVGLSRCSKLIIEECNKLSNDVGGLIRNGQTGPAVIKLAQEYAREKAQAQYMASLAFGQ